MICRVLSNALNLPLSRQDFQAGAQASRQLQERQAKLRATVERIQALPKPVFEKTFDINPDKTAFIAQGAAGVVDPESALTALGTDPGVAPCVAVIMRSPEIYRTLLAHMSTSSDTASLGVYP